MRASILPALMLWAAAATACVDADERSTDLQYIHAAIIEPNCTNAGCHSAWTQAGDLDLSSPDAFCEAFTTGNPPSTLLTLVKGEGEDDDYPQMPPDNPLPAAEIAVLEAWVQAGAPCE